MLSILGQTRPVDEIVISDDGSIDATTDIAADVLSTAPARTRVSILRSAGRRGIAGNFDHALTATTGDIVLLSDQDDVWKPDRVEASVEAFESTSGALLVHGDAVLVDGAGKPLPQSLFDVYRVRGRALADLRTERAFQRLLRRNLVTGATAAVRRELIDIATPIPDGWLHDEWLALVAAASGRIVTLAKPLIEYRQHDNNAIGAVNESVRGVVRRLRQPATPRYQLHARRAIALARRYEELPHTDDIGRQALRGKLRHELARIPVGPGALRRLPGALREVLTGRYWRYGEGSIALAQDLLQPWERRG